MPPASDNISRPTGGERPDIGAWGGLDPYVNYGIVGVDTKIALMTQGPTRPVSVAIRPSISAEAENGELASYAFRVSTRF